MKNLRRVAAVTLAVAMAAGSSFAAFADDPTSGSLSGTGQVEGTVNKNVVKVILPTDTVGDTTYNFNLDPEGLIKATAAAKYPGATFGEGSMFFKNSDTSYSNTSNTKEIINKSSMAVDVTLTATVTAGNDNIKLNSDPSFADDTTTSMYMALKEDGGANSQVAAVDSTGVAKITTTLDALADAYEIVYATASDAYKYVLKDDATGFETFAFALTGACNTKADWSQLSTIAPTVDVVWSFTEHSDNQNVLTSNGSNDIIVYYQGNKPASVTLTPITITGTNKAPITLSTADKVVITNETVSVTKSCLTTLINSSSRGAGTYKLTVNGTDYSVTLTK